MSAVARRPTRRSFMHRLSIHSRLSLLLVLVTVPFVALLIYDTFERHQALRRGVQDQMLQLARLAAGIQNQVIDHSRQLLDVLATNPLIAAGDWPGCRAMLPEFLAHFRGSHSNFVVADLRGDVVCSGVPLAASVNISDIRDFQEVLATQRFVVGDLVFARTTKTWVVLLRAPVHGPDGTLIATVSAPVPVERFAAAASAIALPDDGELLVVDRGGMIIARRPGPIPSLGAMLPAAALLRAMRERTEGIVEVVRADGLRRAYGFAAAGHGDHPGVHVAIGAPWTTVATELNLHLATNVAAVIAIALAVFALASYSVRRFVSSKLAAIVATASRLREGDSTARTGLRADGGELNRLGETIDLMAQALQSRESDLMRAMQNLEEQAVTDPLTGLLNRRYLREFLPRELARAKRQRTSLSVIALDLDHFKRVNDTFGHEAGDVVLRKLGALLGENVRASDAACRFGGEEFVVVLLDAAPEQARRKAESLRTGVEALDIQFRGESIGRITASLGVAAYPDDGTDADSLLRAADMALYEAKGSGRNRVVMAKRPDRPES